MRPALTAASKLVLDLPTLEGWKAELTRLPVSAPTGSRTRAVSMTSTLPSHDRRSVYFGV